MKGMSHKKNLPLEQNHSMFAFNMYPRVVFEDQWENEQIVLLLRASPVTLVPWVFNTFLFTALLLFLNFFFPLFLSVVQIIFLNVFIVSGIFSYAWINFLIWYYNVGVITNMRVIDFDFHDILHRQVTQAEIKQITDVTAQTIGFGSAFFNYGSIYVKTEGFQQNIEFLNTPDANKVVDIINRLLRDPDSYDKL